MQIDPFESSERSRFFARSGIPAWDSYVTYGTHRRHYPYMVYACHVESAERIAELQKGSVLVAQVFDKVADRIRSWQEQDLLEWGFPEKYFDLLNLSWDRFFCLRINWAYKEGQLKFMEINAERPVFWHECEVVNTIMASHFGLQDPTPGTFERAKAALNQAAARSVAMLPTERQVNPVIGLLARNHDGDMDTMRWLTTFLEYETEVMNIDDLDFTKGSNQPINMKTGQKLDTLLFWYPIEYLVDMKFENGESVLEVFIKGLKQRSFTLIHALPAFFIQPKSIQAYITAHADELFVDELTEARKYFPLTYFKPEPLGADYFAKPIWGREGRGCYMVKDGETIRGRFQDDFFLKQKYIYQELLTLPQIKVGPKMLYAAYEAWVYRVGDTLQPGGIGIRAGESKISDPGDFCVPLGQSLQD